MRRSVLMLPLLGSLLFSVCPAARACEEPGVYPPVQGTTHIESISPQVGIAGITQVDVQGYCFGDTQGTGSITLNGETMTSIKYWSDAVIIFDLPFDATTGDLKVTSSSYGSDDSASEAGCPKQSNYDWCGNDEINADFVVDSPSDPPLCCNYNLNPPVPFVTGAPSPAQYVSGTWLYSDGAMTFTFNLTQGAQNTDGTWPITGTEQNSLCGTMQISGTLDQYGDLALLMPCFEDNFTCVQWLIQGSGDVTSQGLQLPPLQDCPPNPPLQGFQQEFSTRAEGFYYYTALPPLFKGQTDQPASETPLPQGWTIAGMSKYATYGLWERTLPASSDGLVEFGGRFVFEQSGGAATDGCFFPNSQYVQVTSILTGGGWYVDPTGDWGPDTIGAGSQFDSYYQSYWGPKGDTCEVTGPQAMHIDARTGPPTKAYTTNTLMPAEITPTELLTGVQPQGGQMVTECENYSAKGVGKGKCK